MSALRLSRRRKSSPHSARTVNKTRRIYTGHGGRTRHTRLGHSAKLSPPSLDSPRAGIPVSLSMGPGLGLPAPWGNHTRREGDCYGYVEAEASRLGPGHAPGGLRSARPHTSGRGFWPSHRVPRQDFGHQSRVRALAGKLPKLRPGVVRPVSATVRKVAGDRTVYRGDP